ncbi:MAG: alpha/beta hydrolase [Acidobacteriota bacterium]|nr:alpha/beta hydrolase [Acidobacteriota bacterium]
MNVLIALRPLALCVLASAMLTAQQRAGSAHGTLAPRVGYTPEQIAQMPVSPAARIVYGSDARQFGELRLPRGRGPFPVAVVIHGGCWISHFADLHQTSPLATALTQAGIATWNIEYRKIGDAGGGWPNMYRDVSVATDFLRTLAPRHNLDLKRVIVIGHSAGGHLAMWVAARHKLPADSPLRLEATPLPLRGAVSLDGWPDLHRVIEAGGTSCGEPALEGLIGGRLPDAEKNFRQASVTDLLPLGVKQISLVRGEEVSSHAYEIAAKRAGDPIEVVPLAGVAHMDFVAPPSAAWPAVKKAARSLLK